MSDDVYVELEKVPYDKRHNLNDPWKRIALHWLDRHKKPIVSTVFLFILIFGGAGIIRAIEIQLPASGGYDPVTTWTYLNAVYFSVVTLTTIGYGDLQPHTTGGVIFTGFFIVVGIGIGAFALSTIPPLFASVLKGCLRRMRKTEGDFVLASDNQQLIAAAIGLIVYALFGAGMFTWLEGFTFSVALYFIVITLCTVGYGDVVATTPIGRAFLCAYCLFGVAAVVLFIGACATRIYERTKTELEQVALQYENIQLCTGGPFAWLSRNRAPVLWSLGMTTYVMVGAVGIKAIEGGFSIEFNSTLPNAWTYGNSVYFCLETLTTIGYGDMVPDTTASRAYTCCFLIFGLMIVTATVSVVASTIVHYGVKRAGSLVIKLSQRKFSRPDTAAVATAATATTDDPPSWTKNPLTRLLLGILGFILYLLIGAGIFNHTEGWAYALAMYFCVITASTVGFGDGFGDVLYPSNPASRVAWAFYAILGVFVVGTLMNFVGLTIATRLEEVANILIRLRKRLQAACRRGAGGPNSYQRRPSEVVLLELQEQLVPDSGADDKSDDVQL